MPTGTGPVDVCRVGVDKHFLVDVILNNTMCIGLSVKVVSQRSR